MNLIYFVTLPFAILSLLGSILILIVCARFELLRASYPFRLIYILTIIDLVWEISLVFPSQAFNSHFFCVLQGFVNQSFNIADILWVSFMSFEMFNVVIMGNEKLKFGYGKPLLLILIISSGTGIIPVLFDCYDLVDGWCWIGSNNPAKKSMVSYLQFFLFSVFIISGFIWNAFVSWKVYFKLKTMLREDNYKLFASIRYYPIIILIAFFPIIIEKLIETFSKSPLGYHIIACCIFASGGLFNVLVYGMTYEVKKLIKRGLIHSNSNFVEIVYS